MFIFLVYLVSIKPQEAQPLGPTKTFDILLDFEAVKHNTKEISIHSLWSLCDFFCSLIIPGQLEF
jgi:hypothetical protein